MMLPWFPLAKSYMERMYDNVEYNLRSGQVVPDDRMTESMAMAFKLLFLPPLLILIRRNNNITWQQRCQHTTLLRKSTLDIDGTTMAKIDRRWSAPQEELQEEHLQREAEQSSGSSARLYRTQFHDLVSQCPMLCRLVSSAISSVGLVHPHR